MKNHILCCLAFFLCFNLSAQTSRQLAKTTIPLSKVERVILPKIDNKSLKEKELKARATTKARALQFAHPIEVSITPKTHGTWENLDKGNAVWRLKVHSADALSLNLGFSQFFLPQNSRFFIYTPDREHILGPFTANDNDLHKQLWTPIIKADEIVLELQIARTYIPRLLLELSSVNHDFMGVDQRKLSGSCNLDVVCSALDGFPRVDDYRDIIRSAGAYTLGGIQQCSGALINTSRNDCTPYFLTADHCGVRNGNAPSVVVYWNYENSTCRQPDSPESGAPGDGTFDIFNSGSSFKATYAPSDFTLIELDDPIAEAATPYFSGWDRNLDPPSGAIGIHHPGVEEKRISFEDDPCTFGSWTGTPNTHVVVNDWDTGTTEGGSSGSPLFNLDKQIVGQLTGGGAACGNDESDLYGWINVSWEGGGTPQTRLKDWLDPDDLGLMELNGKDCSYGLSLTQNFLEVCNQNIDEFSFDLTITDNFVGNVGLYLEQTPEGLSVDLGTNPLETGGTTSVNLGNLSALAAGVYSLEFFGSDGFNTGSTIFILTIIEDVPVSPNLVDPPNEQTDVITNPTYEWEMVANSTYAIEVALDENFENVVITADNLTDEAFVGTTLETETLYYWRTKATNTCGDGDWSEAFRFTTADIRCAASQSNNVPVAIAPFPPATIVSTIEINELGKIADLDVINLRGTHSFIGDLIFELVSPAGTTVLLIEEQCGTNTNFDVNFSDQADVFPPCPYTDGGTYRSVEDLSAFNGESPMGVWELRVTDTFPGDGGSLDSWGLQICTVPDFELLTSTGVTGCVNTSLEIPITVGGAFDDPGATMAINGLPEGAEVTFSENPATPGATVTAIIDNITAIGVYSLTISASDGTHNSFTQINMTIVPPVGASPNPNLPENGTTITGLNTAMNWGILGGITGYHIEISSDEDFNNVLVSEIVPTVDYNSPDLEGNTTYYWRVSGVNACGNGEWSEVYSFRTPKLTCGQAVSEEPLEISDLDPSIQSSEIEITEGGSIIDVNVSDIRGAHSFVGDLIISLISPAGTRVTLLSEECGNQQDFDISFDDEADTDIACPLNAGNTHLPTEDLSAFIGEDAAGTWRLQVEDIGLFDGGVLQNWRLQVCTEPDVSLTSASETVTACPEAITTFSLEIGGGFDEAMGVSLTAEGLPMGATANFSDSPATPGSTVEVNIEGLNASGNYTITFVATDGTDTANTEVNISILGIISEATSLTSPADGSMLATISPNLEWAAIAGSNGYNLELSTTEDFTAITHSENVDGATTNFNPPTLDGNTTYYWRVRGTNDCSEGPWSSVFRFTTPNVFCSESSATNLAIAIDPNITQTYTSTLVVEEQGTILDLNIGVSGIHSYIGDLTFTITSPSGTTLVLVDGQCTESETFNVLFDDAASTPLPCPYDDGGSHLPQNALSVFNGELSLGTWTLQVSDNAEADGGSLEAWRLNLCVEPQEVLPPIADFTVGIDGFDIFVSDNSDGATSWFWDFGDDNTFEGQNPPIHTYAEPGEYNICLTVTNSAGTNSVCQTVQIIDTSIDPILANKLIRFYPNPTNHLLNIDFDTSLQTAVNMGIYGVNGQQVLQYQLTANETASTTIVDLSSLSTGVYMVRLTSNDWTVTKKIVKE